MTSSDDHATDPAVAGRDGARHDARLAALEQQMAALRAEVASLRATMRPASSPVSAPPSETPAHASSAPYVSPAVAAALRQAPRDEQRQPAGTQSFSDRMHSGATISGDELESIVGRYGMPALAALMILMAVGALIKVAVEHGLLTPEVRIGAGALAAILVGAAGLYFRQRDELRYGNVLLALSLAIVDVVAWGAGPRLQLIPTTVALGIVDVVAIALAVLALSDGSEFLFSVAVAGALSAPFVTSDGGGTALGLLLYGGTVLVGSLRTARDPQWVRAFAVLVVGALVYSLAAGQLPISASWYGPYLIAMFGGVLAAAALLFAEPSWRSELPRVYLAVTVFGVILGWDAIAGRPLPVTMAVAFGLAVVTYASLMVRNAVARVWTASALLLPFVSLGVASAGIASRTVNGAVFALWAVFALVAWRVEHRAGDEWRGATHLLAGSLMGIMAVSAWLWPTPLAFVAGLAAWSVVVAWLGRSERHPHAVAGVAIAVTIAALSAIDQLASRGAYSYVPFATRSSASALCAALGIVLVGELIGKGDGARVLCDRPVRLGVLIGFVILWGRMELAQAFNADLAAFLLVSYYAACGVASIIAGRRLGIGRLRVAGLALAIYAGVKGAVQVTDIGSVLLRVGAYAAVGVFLLGAGYLYREQRAERTASMG
jgi:uncharacterized membrane protein